jgi:phosphoribosyl 1,2-cyclic phosphodiesterase
VKVKVWGCRGSLPTPGSATLKYGGESTCVEVMSEERSRIVIDAGSGIRKLGASLLKDRTVSRINLLLTHSHWDHIAGFPFFAPAYVPRFSISICGGPRPQRTVWEYLTHQMEAPYFPVDSTALKAKFILGCGCDRVFCDHYLPQSDRCIQCHSIPLNHPNGGYGFKFIDGAKTFIFLTDNEIRFSHEGGMSRDAYVEVCSGADLLFHDAQYTEKEYSKRQSWGHSSSEDAVELAMDAGVKRLGLFHHDLDRTDEDLDREVDRCRDRIAKARSSLECFACADGMLIDV